jgi:hypothetical protein
MVDQLVDRVLSLAPLAVLMYVLRRQDRERHDLLVALDRDRTAFRDERRELLNRVLFPHAMPVATRPARQAPAPTQDDELAKRRPMWGGVGTAEPPFLPGLPGDADDVPGGDAAGA